VIFLPVKKELLEMVTGGDAESRTRCRRYGWSRHLRPNSVLNHIEKGNWRLPVDLDPIVVKYNRLRKNWKSNPGRFTILVNAITACFQPNNLTDHSETIDTSESVRPVPPHTVSGTQVRSLYVPLIEKLDVGVQTENTSDQIDKATMTEPEVNTGVIVIPVTKCEEQQEDPNREIQANDEPQEEIMENRELPLMEQEEDGEIGLAKWLENRRDELKRMYTHKHSARNMRKKRYQRANSLPVVTWGDNKLISQYVMHLKEEVDREEDICEMVVKMARKEDAKPYKMKEKVHKKSVDFDKIELWKNDPRSPSHLRMHIDFWEKELDDMKTDVGLVLSLIRNT
jgi:hypothetical protein